MRVIQWMLDNLFAVFIIAGVLAQLLQAIRKKGQGDGAEPPEAQQREYEFEDPELAERTRRIREDIQRRIAERQRAGRAPVPEQPQDFEPQPAAFEQPPPLRREVVMESPAPPPVRLPTGFGSRMESQRAAEILEQQATLAERLRQAQEMKAASLRRAAFEEKTLSPQTKQRQQRRGALLDDLRDPDALRRAFVLREVLGPPVGLR